MYESAGAAWRLEVAALKLALGGGGSGPDGGGAGRMGRMVVEVKPFASFERPSKLLGELKLSLSLGRSTCTVELLEDRGGNMGRSKDGPVSLYILVPAVSLFMRC